MKMRRITSLTALTGFVLLAFSSVILYVAPQGRVAYWSDWRFLGLGKDQWGDLHINLGLLFLISISLHIYYNWTPILTYLKSRAKTLRVFTPEFHVALVVTGITIFGTFFQTHPFTWVSDLNTSIKAAAADRYGEPPYGHAELSQLKGFIAKTGLDYEKALAALAIHDIRYASDQQTLIEIARANKVAPKVIFKIMQSAEMTTRGKIMPDTPPPGTGRLKLAELCNTYGIDIPTALAVLHAEGIPATSELTLRAIADKNGLSPINVYEILYEALSTDPLPEDG